MTNQADSIPTEPTLPKVHMKDLQYHQVLDALSTIQISEVVDCGSQLLEDTEFNALHLLKQSISSFYVSNCLKGMSSTVDFNSKDTFLISFLVLARGLTEITQG